MLVLTRRDGEEIIVEGGIRIVVLRVDGNKVRLGIDAPEDVLILRKELIDRAEAAEATEATEATEEEPPGPATGA